MDPLGPSNATPRPYQAEDQKWIVPLAMSLAIPQKLIEELLSSSGIEGSMIVVPETCCLLSVESDDGQPERILVIGAPEVAVLVGRILCFLGREDIELKWCHYFPATMPVSGAIH